MFDMLILLHDQGVYAVATESSDGIECQYYLEGTLYATTIETDQFDFVSYLE